MNPIHRSIIFSALERYGRLALLFVSTAVLARLLTPSEFGIYAIVNAIVLLIIGPFQEFGGANYLIQRRSLSRKNIQTAFTVTFGISMMIGVALFMSRDALAWFFKQDSLAIGIAVATLSFALTPFSMTISALFRREMEFGKIAICNLAANFASVTVSILLAVEHYSFMAPIWGAVAGNLVLSALLIASYKDMRIFRPSLWEYPDVMRFGMYSGATVVINALYNLTPQIFLARILDFAAVGLYSRAYSVLQIFDMIVGQVLAPVILPAISAQAKAGENLKRVYLDAVELLTAVYWPFLAFIAIMAHPIILLWLGPTWTEVVPLVRVMCIAYLALFASCLTYPILVAVGSVNDALKSSLISLPPSLLLVFFASFFGVQAVAATALLTLPFQATVAIHLIGRHLGIGLSDIVRATFKSGMVTVVSSAGAAVCAVMVEQNLLRPLFGLGLAGASTAICWLSSMAVTEHPLLPRLHVAVGSFIRKPALKLASHTKSDLIG